MTPALNSEILMQLKQFQPRKATRKAGYALIVVLGMLATLALVFSITTVLVQTRSKGYHSEFVLAKKNSRVSGLLDVALVSLLDDPAVAGKGLQLAVDGVFYDIQYQDVAGLIDLNTASPELLDPVFVKFNIEPDMQDIFWEWRGAGNAFYRLSDFQSLMQTKFEDGEELTEIATVLSGRRGVSLDVAPEEVTSLFPSLHADQDQLDPRLIEYFSTPPSDVNFRVLISANGQRIGAGEISISGGIGRIASISYG